MKAPTLEDVYGTFLGVLHSSRQRYLVIGALAVGMLGEARLTHDLDFLLFLSSEELPRFLRRVKQRGFQFDSKTIHQHASETGAFRLSYHGVPVDCLMATTSLEEQMWHRSKKLRLHRRLAHFPSPEDLILLKLLPGRPKDLLDVESIFTRRGKGLDVGYLKKTAQRMADELQDARIWHRLQPLLKSASSR